MQMIVLYTGLPGPKNFAMNNANETKMEIMMTMRAIRSSFITFIFFHTQRNMNLKRIMVAQTIEKDIIETPLKIRLSLHNQKGRGPTITLM